EDPEPVETEGSEPPEDQAEAGEGGEEAEDRDEDGGISHRMLGLPVADIDGGQTAMARSGISRCNPSSAVQSPRDQCHRTTASARQAPFGVFVARSRRNHRVDLYKSGLLLWTACTRSTSSAIRFDVASWSCSPRVS